MRSSVLSSLESSVKLAQYTTKVCASHQASRSPQHQYVWPCAVSPLWLYCYEAPNMSHGWGMFQFTRVACCLLQEPVFSQKEMTQALKCQEQLFQERLLNKDQDYMNEQDKLREEVEAWRAKFEHLGWLYQLQESTMMVLKRQVLASMLSCRVKSFCYFSNVSCEGGLSHLAANFTLSGNTKEAPDRLPPPILRSTLRCIAIDATLNEPMYSRSLSRDFAFPLSLCPTGSTRHTRR